MQEFEKNVIKLKWPISRPIKFKKLQLIIIIMLDVHSQNTK